MRAVTYREHGGLEVIDVGELPTLEPGPGQVRVKVAACAMNHLDVWVRRGIPGVKLEMPHIPGADIAGTIDAVGVGVSGWAVGAPVVVHPVLSCGRCRACAAGQDNQCRHFGLVGEHARGGMAEYLIIAAGNLVAAPAGLPLAELAAIPTTFLTAWQMLVTKANVRPGETVLVLAAGSGVGVAGVQIARLLGAEVIAAASTDDKLARARELGAHHGINYATADLVAETRRITGKRGVDVVFEHVGAATWDKSILAAARGGRIVTCGSTSGHMAQTDLRHVFFRQLTIYGSTMGTKADLLDILDHVAKGRLKPVIDSQIAMTRDAIVAAHERLEARGPFGKILVIPAT